VAVEKRVNFTLQSMCPTAHAYDFFRGLFSGHAPAGCVTDGSSCHPNGNALHEGLQGRQIPTDTVFQHFDYQRSNDLELWEIF
jgi:hypothetical protein